MGTRPRTQIDEGYGPVNSHESAVENLRLELGVICEEAKTYFEQVNRSTARPNGSNRGSGGADGNSVKCGPAAGAGLTGLPFNG